MAEKSNTQIDEYVDFDTKDEMEEGRGPNIKARFIAFLSGHGFTISIIILAVIIAFSLGRFFQIRDTRPPVKIMDATSTMSNMASVISAFPPKTPAPSEVPNTNSGIVVASKSGTKYHYPWCPGAKQIASKNLITFNSIEEARAKGYTPASNCKGLK